MIVFSNIVIAIGTDFVSIFKVLFLAQYFLNAWIIVRDMLVTRIMIKSFDFARFALYQLALHSILLVLLDQLSVVIEL